MKLTDEDIQIIKELLKDRLEDCNNEIEHYKHQKFIKQQKGQLEQAEAYDKEIINTLSQKTILQSLLDKISSK
jgi:DNA-binding transcriptional regulator GbsR (MarR family)